MHYAFCPECGLKLVDRAAGDDGTVPYCDRCRKYWFDTFPCCSIILIANQFGEIALLKQLYLSDRYMTFCAGYMSPGETAEETAVREAKEELGLDLASLENCGTYWFAAKGILMHGFIARVEKRDFVLSSEVDDARWVKAEDAANFLFPDRPGNVVHALLRKYLAGGETKG